MTTQMPTTPEEILAACEALGVTLRVNPTDGALTANPKKKLSEPLLMAIREKRASIIELLECLKLEEGDVTIEPIVPPEPAKPSVAEQLIKMAAARGVEIRLDQPTAMGRIMCITPIDEVHGHRMSLPMAVGQAMASEIANRNAELLAYLRAPYIRALPKAGTEEAAKRGIWERIAVPDDQLPSQADNQSVVRELLQGGQQGMSPADLKRQQLAEAIAPKVIAQNL